MTFIVIQCVFFFFFVVIGYLQSIKLLFPRAEVADLSGKFVFFLYIFLREGV